VRIDIPIGDAIIAIMKTGTSTSRFAAEDMRAFLRRKVADEKARDQELWWQASQDAETMIRMVIDKFAPQAVSQWGSVLDGRQFSEISDIDIAVEGSGSAERYFAMLGEAGQWTHFPLDLVELEHVEPEYAELIRRNGCCVYARQDSKA
jgi:predicted nucleotidyltransferase